MTDPLFVLVGGWPGSGKSTLARRLAPRLGLALLSKDDAKEALMNALGPPADVEASRHLGVAAVHVLLRLARDCPGAVVDSTWYPYVIPLVEALPGAMVEVRCVVDLPTARARYLARTRDERHLDDRRSEDELWADPVAPLGSGPLIEVDTTSEVDIDTLAQAIMAAAPNGATD